MTPFKFHVRSGNEVMATGTLRSNGRVVMTLGVETTKLGGFTREIVAKINDTANLMAEDPRIGGMTVFDGLHEVRAGSVSINRLW